MVKYFIKFLFTAVFMALFAAETAVASKIGRISFDELMVQSELVAVVKIVASEISSSNQPQIHTDVKKNYILHSAVIIQKIRGRNRTKEIMFLSTIGLISGNEYVVFLNALETKDGLVVAINGYAALGISLVSLKTGFQKAVRVPESYLIIPPQLTKDQGVTTKNELPSFIWLRYKDLVEYLDEA